jgi:Lon-like protease
VTTSVNTSEGMVTPPQEHRPATLLPPWWVMFAVMALVGFFVSAAVVRLPYYAMRPGSVRDTRVLIDIEGAETYVPEGAISYTTVALREVTLFSLLYGWWDDDIAIVEREDVSSSSDPDEQRQINLAMMATSKEIATYVALESLGYDIPASATGNIVVGVTDGMPADGVLEVGDIVVAIDGERIDAVDDLSTLMEGKHPGDEVALVVQDPVDGSERDVTLELGADPDDADRGIMGVYVEAYGVEFDFPVDVAVETGDVGGPSAGLAFTLAIIDELTPGELTGDHQVAATGEIQADGSVLQVGGVEQKAAAARQSGAELFLVPDGEGAGARTRAGDDMEVVEVSTLDEALEALADVGGNGLELPQVGAERPAA